MIIIRAGNGMYPAGHSTLPISALRSAQNDRRASMKRFKSLILLLLAAIIPVLVLGGFFGQYLLKEQMFAYDREIADKATSLSTALEKELATNIELLVFAGLAIHDPSA